MGKNKRKGPEKNTAAVDVRNWQNWLFEPIDNIRLVVFRIAFGCLLAIDLAQSWDWRIVMLSDRPIRFPYDGLGWLPLLPQPAAIVLQASLILACASIATGYCYRLGATVFFLGYTYSFLLDRAYFNNHFYLIAMFGGWLVVCNSHYRWALGRPAPGVREAPRWQVLGPAAQMSIPYFFGGLAKINPDWLRGEPVRAQLRGLTDYPFYGTIIDESWAGIAFAWGGLLFDLLIIPALFWRRSRILGVVALVFFHVTNSLMFTIGIFPWLGIASTVLFLPDRILYRLIPFATAQVNGASPTTQRQLHQQHVRPVVAWLFVCWFVAQSLIPLRHYFIPGNVGWTREGFYFAWTMKLDLKSCFLGYHVCDPVSGRCLAIDHNKDLTDYQRYWLPRDPRGIAQYARFLRKQALQKGGREVVIVCDSVCALNGRPYQYMIDPAVDPSTVLIPRWGHASWIQPLNLAAAVGNYKAGAAKEAEVMALIHRTRVADGIFPEPLRGLHLQDVTPNHVRP